MQQKTDSKISKKIEFTDENIRRLSTDKHSEQWTDTAISGLVIRVYPSGAKSFWVDQQFADKRTFKNVGRWPSVNAERARQVAREIKTCPSSLKVSRNKKFALPANQRDMLIHHLKNKVKSASDPYSNSSSALLVWMMVRDVRKSEVVKMRWSDLDLESGVWVWRSDGLRYALPPNVTHILRQRRKFVEFNQIYVFPSRLSKSGHCNFPSELFAEAIAKVGVEPTLADALNNIRNGAARF